MELSGKDLIAILIVTCLTVLVVLGKASFELIAPIISLIAGYYFGYAYGVRAHAREQKG